VQFTTSYFTSTYIDSCCCSRSLSFPLTRFQSWCLHIFLLISEINNNDNSNIHVAVTIILTINNNSNNNTDNNNYNYNSVDEDVHFRLSFIQSISQLCIYVLVYIMFSCTVFLTLHPFLLLACLPFALAFVFQLAYSSLYTSCYYLYTPFAKALFFVLNL